MKKFSITLVALFLVVYYQPVYAQTAQSLSVSPTLFEMSANPGQQWQSTIRIVNPNPYPLTVYVTAVNFEPQGEAGNGSLLPVVSSESEGLTLAEWMEYNREPVTVAPEKTYELPFTVSVPGDASPGGHFAAFMVGTVPPQNEEGATKVRTSQVVTSLFFLRVAGDVVEQGSIREFTTSKTFYQKPEVELTVRFENSGNVHLRPQGDILITNMWGQERGVIPINHQSHFGNVLPDSTRKFSFTWKSDWKVADMGRYSAIVTLAYGTEERKFVTSKTYFWVIPVVPLMTVLGTLILTLYALSWLVRRYIRKMLAQSGLTTVSKVRLVPNPIEARRDLSLRVPDTILAPAPVTTHERWKWLRQSSTRISDCAQYTVRRIKHVWSDGAKPSRAVLVVSAGLLIMVSAVVVYLYYALVPSRSYEVTYSSDGQAVSVSSDEIMFEQKKQDVAKVTIDESTTTISVINSSGVAGLGATVAMLLEESGHTVESIDTELGAQKGRTVIVYVPAAEEEAVQLSQQLNNAMLSVVSDRQATGTPITIFVGKDLAQSE